MAEPETAGWPPPADPTWVVRPPAIAAVVAAAAPVVLLLGGPGCGKTVLARQAVTATGDGVAWLSAADLAAGARPWADGPPILVVDDVQDAAPDALQALLVTRPPDSRIWLVGRRLPAGVDVPGAWAVPPEVWRWAPEDLMRVGQALALPWPEAVVADVAWASAGWIGGFCRCATALTAPPASAALVLYPPALLDELDATVLAGLSPACRERLQPIGLAGSPVPDPDGVLAELTALAPLVTVDAAGCHLHPALRLAIVRARLRHTPRVSDGSTRVPAVRTVLSALVPDDISVALDALPADQRQSWPGRILTARLAQLEGRLDEARSALAAEPDPTDPTATGYTLLGRGGLADGALARRQLHHAESVLATLPESEGWLRANAHLHVSGYWWLQRCESLQQAHAVEALTAFTAADDPPGRMRALSRLGASLLQAGETERAVVHLAEAIQLARQGHRAIVAQLLGHWGALLHLVNAAETTLSTIDAGLQAAAACDFQGRELILQVSRILHLQQRGDGDAAARERAAFGQRVADLGVPALRGLADLLASAPAPVDEALGPANRLLRIRQHVALAVTALAAGRPAGVAAPLEALAIEMRQAGAPFIAAWAQAFRTQVLAADSSSQPTDGVRRAAQLAVPDRADGWWVDPTANAPAATDGERNHLYVKAFGRFDVRTASGTPVFGPLQGHRPKMLFALLILEPGGLSRDTIAERLYGDDDEVNPKTVQMLIRRLRDSLAQALAPWETGETVVWQHGRYVLNPAVTIASDAQAFEAAWHVAQARSSDHDAHVDACRRLLTLYEGPLLDEFATEPWALLRQEQARQRAATALDWLADHLQATDGIQSALDWVDAFLAKEMTCEQAHRTKLRLLMAAGQADAARAHGRSLVTVLHRTLGVGPADETRAILQALGLPTSPADR